MSEAQMHADTYQKNQVSCPIFLVQSAMYSTVPLNTDTLMAYGTASPKVRTSTGKSSAFAIVLTDEYIATTASAAMTTTNATTGLCVPLRKVKTGTVPIVPNIPKVRSSGRRPMRSDNAP